MFYLLPLVFTKDNIPVRLYNKDITSLAHLIYNAILNNIPSLKLLNKYLEEWVDVMNELDLPIVWITPSGLKIKLSIVKFDKIRSRSKLLPYGKPVTISLPTNELNKKKIKSSLMPNLVHSLDASNIHLLIDYLKNEPLFTIHDCFASTPNNMSKMELMVKNVFIKIYLADSNYLEKMHNNFIDQINSYIPIDNIIYENDDIFILIKKNNKDMKLKLPNLQKGYTNKIGRATCM